MEYVSLHSHQVISPRYDGIEDDAAVLTSSRDGESHSSILQSNMHCTYLARHAAALVVTIKLLNFKANELQFEQVLNIEH